MQTGQNFVLRACAESPSLNAVACGCDAGLGCPICQSAGRRSGAQHVKPLTSNLDPTGYGRCPASPLLEAARIAKSPLAVVLPHESGGSVMFANDAFAALLERPASDLEGQALWAMASSADDAIEVKKRLIHAGQVRVATMPLTRVQADGSRVRAALSLAGVVDDRGASFCILCSLVDLSRHDSSASAEQDAEALAQLAGAASDLLRSEAALPVHEQATQVSAWRK